MTGVCVSITKVCKKQVELFIYSKRMANEEDCHGGLGLNVAERQRHLMPLAMFYGISATMNVV